MEFTYDGGGPGKGGNVSLYLDGTKIADGHVPRTHTAIFSSEETTDVGREPAARSLRTTPTQHLHRRHRRSVRIDIGDDDHSHLIDPQHLLTIAMTIQ